MKLMGLYLLQILQWCARGGLYLLHMVQNLGLPVNFFTSYPSASFNSGAWMSIHKKRVPQKKKKMTNPVMRHASGIRGDAKIVVVKENPYKNASKIS
jgi:hypothetical protein